MSKLLVAVFDTKSYTREFLDLAAKGLPIEFRYENSRICAATAGSAEGARVISAFVNDRLDEHCLTKLQEAGVEMIALRSVGFNNVDLEAARRLKLSITRVPAYSPYAVAEQAVALLLAVNRKIHLSYQRVKSHNFSLDGLTGFDIHGKTVGVIGTGRIGKAFTQIMQGFGATIIAFDPYPNVEWARSRAIDYVPFDEILARSDILSLHLPLTKETEYLLNEQTLKMLKPNAVLLNTSRGKLVDTAALIKQLAQGRLGGAGLDVYEREEEIFFEDFSKKELQDELLVRLLQMPNVVVSAHQGFLTREALQEISRVTVENAVAFHQSRAFLPSTSVIDSRGISV
jgi:D-lactate dehydrogenase